MLMSLESLTEVKMSWTHAGIRRSGICWDFFMAILSAFLMITFFFLVGLVLSVCVLLQKGHRPITAAVDNKSVFEKIRVK